jgi:hypothetical protein
LQIAGLKGDGSITDDWTRNITAVIDVEDVGRNGVSIQRGVDGVDLTLRCLSNPPGQSLSSEPSLGHDETRRPRNVTARGEFREKLAMHSIVGFTLENAVVRDGWIELQAGTENAQLLNVEVDSPRGSAVRGRSDLRGVVIRGGHYTSLGGEAVMRFSYDPDRDAAPQELTIEDAHLVIGDPTSGGIVVSESRLFRLLGGTIEGPGAFGLKSTLERKRGIVHEGFEVVGVTMRDVAVGAIFNSGGDSYGASRLVGNRFHNVPTPYFTFGDNVDPSLFEISDNRAES